MRNGHRGGPLNRIVSRHLKRILFVCTQNKLRSPTAEQVFSSWADLEVASAGLGNDAATPVSPELIAWAEIIFVMEKAHRNRLSAKFKPHLKDKRVICLDIPDEFEYMDSTLVRLLEARVPRYLGTVRKSAD